MSLLYSIFMCVDAAGFGIERWLVVNLGKNYVALIEILIFVLSRTCFELTGVEFIIEITFGSSNLGFSCNGKFFWVKVVRLGL